MNRSDLRRALRRVRISISKQQRTELTGCVEYHCDCGARHKVGLAYGVIPLELFLASPEAGVIGVLAPEKIDCKVCEQQADYALGFFDRDPAERTIRQPYLRIPSHRYIETLLAEQRFEAEYVDSGGEIDDL